MAGELKALARDRPRPVRPGVRFARRAAAAALLCALAFAVQEGEDGQVGGDRAVSAGIFLLAGCAAVYALSVPLFCSAKKRPARDNEEKR